MRQQYTTAVLRLKSFSRLGAILLQQRPGSKFFKQNQLLMMTAAAVNCTINVTLICRNQSTNKEATVYVHHQQYLTYNSRGNQVDKL